MLSPSKSVVNLLILALLFTVCLLSFVYAQTGSVPYAYTYDDLNRLTQVSYGNGTITTYIYDEIGNRTQLQTTGSTSP